MSYPNNPKYKWRLSLGVTGALLLWVKLILLFPRPMTTKSTVYNGNVEATTNNHGMQKHACVLIYAHVLCIGPRMQFFVYASNLTSAEIILGDQIHYKKL